jgi:hypothetical protein
MRRFLTLAIAAFAGWAFAGNELVNGGFENGLDGWVADGGKISLESHDGAASLMVRQSSPRWSGAWQKVSIPGGVKGLRVGGWLRSDSVRGGKENWERGRLSVEFHDAKDDTVGGYPLAVGQVRGKSGWARVERVYEVPAKASWVKVECALGNSTGTLYCDDLAVSFER